MNRFATWSRSRPAAGTYLLLTVLLLALPLAAQEETQPPKKYALLVGINEYAHADLNRPSPLEYAKAHVAELKDLLERADYKVALLSGRQATLKNIRAALQLLRRRGKGAAVVLAAFAGHGIQPEASKEA